MCQNDSRWNVLESKADRNTLFMEVVGPLKEEHEKGLILLN